MCTSLTRRYRLTKFYVLCDKKGASTVKHHPNVHPFGEGIIFRLVNKVSRTLFGKEAATDFMVKWCGLTIYLGGSLFMEQGDWKKSLRDWKRWKLTQKILHHRSQFRTLSYGRVQAGT